MSAATDPSGNRRSYRSPQREAAARVTRARIRTAAAELFVDQGYAATSMRSVAHRAGVAEKTVYLQFATKSALLREVVETAIVGDDDAVPAADRSWFQELVAEPELNRKLELLADATSALHERSGAVLVMARGAAATDPEVADLWELGKRGHLADMTRLSHSFRASGQLPAGCDEEWVTTSLYVVVGLESWHLVRVELGRDAERYRSWLLQGLRRLFSSPAQGYPLASRGRCSP